MSDAYDGNVALSRKLTEEEIKELKITLLPYFHVAGDGGMEDISDFLDYTFAMVSNQKTVDYIIQELVGMEMEFCNEQVAKKVGKELTGFLKSIDGTDATDATPSNSGKGNRVVSLKSQEEKGNALTMSGALGASREGGRNKTNVNNKDKRDKGKKKDTKENDTHGDRGVRSTHKEAFDRLSRGGRGERGRGGTRRREDGREHDGGRGDRGGRSRRPEDRDGRGGRGRGSGGGRGFDDRHGRGRGRGERMAGNRRGREGFEEDDFVPTHGREGRGRGRDGRGRDDGPKRRRYDFDSHGESYADYEESYGYDDGYGSSFRGRGWTGRGRGRGRGMSGRREGGRPESGEGVETNGNEGPKDSSVGANPDGEGAGNHPSPMVQANLGYRGGGYGQFGGRGFYRRGRGRGRGRFGGRAHVVSMIQSKTWVRKKDDEGDKAPPSTAGEDS